MRLQIEGQGAQSRPLLAQAMQLKAQPRHLGAGLFRDALDAGNAVVDLAGAGRLPGEDEEDDSGQDFEKTQGQEHDAADHETPPKKKCGGG